MVSRLQGGIGGWTYGFIVVVVVVVMCRMALKLSLSMQTLRM